MSFQMETKSEYWRSVWISQDGAYFFHRLLQRELQGMWALIWWCLGVFAGKTGEERFTCVYGESISERQLAVESNRFIYPEFIDRKTKTICLYKIQSIERDIIVSPDRIEFIRKHTRFYLNESRFKGMAAMLPEVIRELYITSYHILHSRVLEKCHGSLIVLCIRGIAEDYKKCRSEKEVFQHIRKMHSKNSEAPLGRLSGLCFSELKELLILKCDMFFHFIDIARCQFPKLKRLILRTKDQTKWEVFKDMKIERYLFRDRRDDLLERKEREEEGEEVSDEEEFRGSLRRDKGVKRIYVNTTPEEPKALNPFREYLQDRGRIALRRDELGHIENRRCVESRGEYDALHARRNLKMLFQGKPAMYKSLDHAEESNPFSSNWALFTKRAEQERLFIDMEAIEEESDEERGWKQEKENEEEESD
eukprot:GHVN01014061.1.p1 GENE.GHVN01014061.1~~GHVN01014061.1.p1  ORF type:complete len:421 (+),score=37.95 GHVN01014061.1:73-1335(+)